MTLAALPEPSTYTGKALDELCADYGISLPAIISAKPTLRSALTRILTDPNSVPVALEAQQEMAGNISLAYFSSLMECDYVGGKKSESGQLESLTNQCRRMLLSAMDSDVKACSGGTSLPDLKSLLDTFSSNVKTVYVSQQGGAARRSIYSTLSKELAGVLYRLHNQAVESDGPKPNTLKANSLW